MSEYPWHFSLAEFEARYCYRRSKSKSEIARDVPFPSEAFAKILHDKGFALPVEWDNRFSFQQKEDSSINKTEIEEQKTVIGETLAPEDMSVVDGICVAQLRMLLDEKNEGTTFCPVLLAGVRTALLVGNKRKEMGSNWNSSAEKRFASRIAEEQCRKLGIVTANCGAKGKEKLEPSKDDKSAVSRCSRLTRKQSK